jgi:predicted RNA-binding protein YlxR (DUF448 family)
MRRCVGCQVAFPQASLIRISAIDRKIRVVEKKPYAGRSIYLCKNEDCLTRAIKRKSFIRMLREDAELDIDLLKEDLSKHIT